MIHVMENQQVGVKIRHNWVHDTVKYGIRFDGEGNGNNGFIHHNVAWKCNGGIMIKGNHHYVYNNTGFDSVVKNDIMVLNTQSGKPINNGTIVANNLEIVYRGHRSNSESFNSSRITAITSGNVEDLNNELTDITNYNFKPKNLRTGTSVLQMKW